MPPTPSSPPPGVRVRRTSTMEYLGDEMLEGWPELDSSPSDELPLRSATPSTSSPATPGTPQHAPPRPPRSPLPPSLPAVPAVNYTDLYYVDEVDETLICPICRAPFHQPITTKTCGHTFCTECLRKAVELKPACPIDRQPLAFHSTELCTPRIVTEQIDRLRVHCPNSDCVSVAPRGLISTHYERDCGFTLVLCPLSSCDKFTPRHEAAADYGCRHAEVQCRYCQKMIVLAEQQHHFNTECEGHMVQCKQCSTLVLRHEVSSHVTERCPETETKCKSYEYGCTVHGKRRDVHIHENQGCVYEAIGKLMRDRAEDQAVIHDLRGRLTALERRRSIDNIRSRNALVPTARGAYLPNLDLHDGRRSPPHPHTGNNDGAAWESPEDFMLAQFERMETKMEDLRKSMTELDGRHSMMLLNETLPLKDQITELRNNLGVVGMHTHWLMNAQRQNRGGAAAVAGGGAAQGGQQQRGGGDGEDGREGAAQRVNVASRRMSGENPPRL